MTTIRRPLGVLAVAVLLVAALAAGGSIDPGLARDEACYTTLHGRPTPLGCRLPDGTVLRPWQIPTEAPR